MIENDIIDNTVYLRTVLFVNSNSDIESLASSGGSGSSGGSSFYHITSTDNTTPSDANGFTALRTLAEIRSAVSNVQTQNYSWASTSNIGIVGHTMHLLQLQMPIRQRQCRIYLHLCGATGH